MNLQLFRSYTASDLVSRGVAVPTTGTEAWFCKTPEDREHILLIHPDSAKCWCFPPITDRNSCFFFSPTRLRLGIDRCHNQEDLLTFYVDTHSLPSELRRVHLLGSLPSGVWCYLGRPTLSSGFGSNGSLTQLEIGLDDKMPESLWLQFGGYSGWLVCMYPHQFVVQSQNDVETIVGTFQNAGTLNLEITRYEGDCLSAITDKTGVSVVTYQSGSLHLHSQGNDGELNDEKIYGFTTTEFPRCWVISRHEAMALIRGFLLNGVVQGLVED
jgi:hypothetical protein